MRLRLLSSVFVIGGAAALACGSDSAGSQFDPAKSDAGTTTPPGFGGDGGLGDTGDPPVRCSPCTDFAVPILDTASGDIPANVSDLFGAPPAGAPANGDPCLIEPEPGAVYPRNWLRPRIRFNPAGDANLFEVRFKIANQSSDLVVYTRAKEWTMDKALWDLLRDHSWDTDITLTIRAGKLDGTTLSNVSTSGGTMRVAPVQATGSIVYWRIIGSEGSELRGFHVGDESVVDALKPEQVKQKETGGCVGCHASSPDGEFVGFGTGDGEHGDSIASIDPASVGTAPPWLGAGASQLMTSKLLHTAPAFTAAHWRDGDHRVLMIGDSDDTSGPQHLYSVDLEAADQGAARKEIARTNDANLPVMPAWSHDGSRVVYVSATKIYDSRIDGTADLYSVAYNDGAGGDATGVPGASDSAYEELYPAFSPDDKWLAFTRVKAAQWDEQHFSNKFSEVLVLPAAGGTPTRLAANDPPACTGTSSPGVTNSWSRFSPEAQTFDGKTYYWLVFSSSRQSANHQLYVTPVIVDTQGNVTTGAALYLWNQPSDQSNHTPAWDTFKIPPATVN